MDNNNDNNNNTNTNTNADTNTNANTNINADANTNANNDYYLLIDDDNYFEDYINDFINSFENDDVNDTNNDTNDTNDNNINNNTNDNTNDNNLIQELKVNYIDNNDDINDVNDNINSSENNINDINDLIKELKVNYIDDNDDGNDENSSENNNINSNINSNTSSNIISNIDNEMCRCLKCHNIFDNDDDFELHICNDSVIINDDNIPTDINGKYNCPMCDNKYFNEILLGEHFIISHNNYNEFGKLDDNIKKNGFPGFDILEYIYMIEIMSDCQIEAIVKNDEKCSICFSNFINNTKYNNNNDDNILPLIMMCCDMFICQNCLQKYIEKKNKLICPFCYTNFCKNDLDYIIIIEPSDKCNDSWDIWWRKHIDIFV